MFMSLIVAASLAALASALPSADTLQVCDYLYNTYPRFMAYDPLGITALRTAANASRWMDTNRVYWNNQNSYDYRSACTFFPANAEQVSNLVKKLNEFPSVQFAIKGGGHNPAPGFSATDGGILMALEVNLGSAGKASDAQTIKVGSTAETARMQDVVVAPTPLWSQLHKSQKQREEATKEALARQRAIDNLPAGFIEGLVAKEEAKSSELERDGFVVQETYDLRERVLVQSRAPIEDHFKNMGGAYSAIGAKINGIDTRVRKKQTPAERREETRQKNLMAEHARKHGIVDEYGRRPKRATQEQEECEFLQGADDDSDEEYTLDTTFGDLADTTQAATVAKEDAASQVPTSQFGKMSFAAAAAASHPKQSEDKDKARVEFFAAKDTKSLKGLNRFALDSALKWPIMRKEEKFRPGHVFEPDLKPYLEKDPVTEERFLNFEHAQLTYHPRLESSPAQKKQWFDDHGMRFACVRRGADSHQCSQGSTSCRYMWASLYRTDCHQHGIKCSAVHGRAEDLFKHCEKIWGVYGYMAEHKSTQKPSCDDYEDPEGE